MKVALQARLLWLFVEGLEICPPKPSMDPPLDATTGSPCAVSSPEYKKSILSRREYLD